MAYRIVMDTHPSIQPELWNRTPPEVQVYIRMLEDRVLTLEGMVQTLQETIRTLQEQLNQSSRNSSRPPSSDSPRHPRTRRSPSKRRRGGQPGHPGHTRTLVPMEEVSEVVAIKPERCDSCQASLSGDDPAPFRHQVIEIPPIAPVITEYQWHLRLGGFLLPKKKGRKIGDRETT
jgi:transposase